MRYRVLKDFCWLKVGDVVDTNDWGQVRYSCVDSKFTEPHDDKTYNSIVVWPKSYPDTFAPLSEEEEKIEEAKKLLEGTNYSVVQTFYPLPKDLLKDLDLMIYGKKLMCRHNYNQAGICTNCESLHHK